MSRVRAVRVVGGRVTLPPRAVAFISTIKTDDNAMRPPSGLPRVRVIDGGEDYRADLVVQQYHIGDDFGITGSPSRVTRLKECFPTSVKPTADFDATAAEVSMAEITLAVEEIEVELVDNG